LSTPAPATFDTGAKIVGALNAVVALGAALLMGYGLADIAHRHFERGVTLLVLVIGVRWLTGSSVARWSDRVGERVRDDWRQRLPGHFAVPRHERERSRGDLATAIEQAADAPALEMLATSARVAMLGLVLLWWSGGWLCLAITVGLLAVAVPLYRRAGTRSEKMALEVEQRRAVLEGRQLELLHHTPELRALGAVDYGANEIAAISDAEHTVAMRAIRVALESSLITEFISGVSIGLVAMVVGFALLGGRALLAHGLVAVLVTSEVFLNVRRYGVEFHRRENSLRSLHTLRDAVGPFASTPCDTPLVADELVTLASPTPVSLRLGDGERVLVTGPSGSGKTTLLHTMIGWRTPVSGAVQRTSAPVGYVSVESALIEGTLRENLTIGADIDDAVLAARLSELGLTGPRFENLDTLILADSRGLSTGERVRLILARALLAHPALLVVDDVAGVLDVASRALVRAALDRDRSLSIIEATVDTPVLEAFTARIEVGA
jgi:ABC-type transport system involved in cytochrome bd biosynthesis fused ATPase/permease subunit